MRLEQERVSLLATRENVGRAEYCLNGEWKIFCGGIGIDVVDAIVFCRQLGYNSIGVWLCGYIKQDSIIITEGIKLP